MKYILAIDQGTSGTKAVIFDEDGHIVSKGFAKLDSLYPRPSFVEQNPLDILQSVTGALDSCLQSFFGNKSDIAGCGISNQRETFLLWDKAGKPITNAIVWQCKRSVDICRRLKEEGIEPTIREKTGLIVDPYFSGTKLLWSVQNEPGVRKIVDEGKAYFGTIDTWLLYKLTEGDRFMTDYTNASRTLFFNINDLTWDNELIHHFGLDNLQLPEVKPSSSDFGRTNFDGRLPQPVNVGSLIGDSHAAAFGERCFNTGNAKATMGTGSSILMNVGNARPESRTGMLATICWSTKDRVDYALEGAIVTCGATIKWLIDQLNLLETSSETEKMALSVPDNNGVYLIPAFSGLGAPHWKMDLRARITGLTFDCNKNHVVRAALESIPYQIKDVLSAMSSDSGIDISELKADGGISANNFVMQFLSDLLDVDVVKNGIEEVSALGAAFLAGLNENIFHDLEQIESLPLKETKFTPNNDTKAIHAGYEQWKTEIRSM